MAGRRDLAKEDLGRLGEDLRQLWGSLTKDPKKEKRKQRAWTMLYGITSAGLALLARKGLMRVWPILTGEEPPTPRLRPVEETPPAQPESPSAAVRDGQLDHEREVVGANVRTAPPVDERQATDETRVQGEPQERG